MAQCQRHLARKEIPVSTSAPTSENDLKRVEALLGGRRRLGGPLTGPLAAHDLARKGLPEDAVLHLVNSLLVLKSDPLLLDALGMSVRTLQRRRKERRHKPMSHEQSGRALKLAEVVAKATQVFGSQAAAEEWLRNPLAALDSRRPIALLATPYGTEMVETHLLRLEHGVYV